jgi:mannose-6-phosphate isomerase-like protein (cupin superfamily)
MTVRTTGADGAPVAGSVVRQAERPLLVARDGEQMFRSTLGAETTGPHVVSGGWYRVAPGVTNHLDMHPDRDEIYFIHRGAATIVMDGRAMTMTAGDTVFVPHGVDHQIRNGPDEALELFYVFAPAAPPYPDRQDDRYPVVEFTPA